MLIAKNAVYKKIKYFHMYFGGNVIKFEKTVKDVKSCVRFCFLVGVRVRWTPVSRHVQVHATFLRYFQV